MYRDLKKVTASGLLLLMAVPLFFTVAVIIKQKVIQFQRQERLEKELLQTITVSTEKIQWAKPGKEAIIDGKLFDVKSFDIDLEKISLTGFFDIREDEVVQDIKDLVQQKNESGNPFRNVSFVKFFFAPVYSQINPHSFLSPWHIIDTRIYIYTEIIPEIFHSADTPPPKYC